MKKKLKQIGNFGEMKLKVIIACLFYVGSIIISYKSIVFGKAIYATNFYNAQISYVENGQRWYKYREVNNLPLGVFSGILYFAIILLIWKLVCELLYIIFERIKRK